MSTLTSVGPMIINGMPQPGQPGVPMMAPNHIALSAQYLAPNGSPFPQHMAQNYRTALGAMPGSSSAPTPTTTSTAAINRSQRCGVCRGCQAKPCSQCTYCQDSPQFGGPGVKKQSCIERRCLRVLENRLQVSRKFKPKLFFMFPSGIFIINTIFREMLQLLKLEWGAITVTIVEWRIVKCVWSVLISGMFKIIKCFITQY